MTTKRRRADLDDEDVPVFVTEVVRRVPRCCGCGREVITARSLWTLCGECIRHSLEIPATPIPRHPHGTHAMIGELARTMALSFGRGDDDHAPLPTDAVLHHEARFLARGLDHGAARRLAEALATDPSHRAGCAICQDDVAAIVEQLEKPRQDTERLARIGRDHLPRRVRRS